MSIELNYQDLKALSDSVGSEITRTALASGKVVVGQAVLDAIESGTISKGDPLQVAKVVGLLAAKKTHTVFPFSRPVPLSELVIECMVNRADESISIQAFAKAAGTSGVQMEAMTAVSVAALAIFEMCKSINPYIEITGIGVDSKTGGQSGPFRKN